MTELDFGERQLATSPAAFTTLRCVIDRSGFRIVASSVLSGRSHFCIGVNVLCSPFRFDVRTTWDVSLEYPALETVVSPHDAEIRKA